MSYDRIVLSSGHGLYVRGASGVLDEVDEARKVVDRVAGELTARGVDVEVFHDNTSHSQNENLNAIVDFHNSCTRDLDVSVHFNAYDGTAKGTETLYITQSSLAAKVSDAIADCGFVNRGAKKRTDLYFLNNTEMPAILIEVCFCDSQSDAATYNAKFISICNAIADVLGGAEESTEPAPPDRPELPERPTRPEGPGGGGAEVQIWVTGHVVVTLNGQPLTGSPPAVA